MELELWQQFGKGKMYNARLDKTLRHCQLDVGRTPARWSICTWKSMRQKTGAGAFVLLSARQQLTHTYSDSQEAGTQGSSRRSVFYIVKQTVELIKNFFSFLFWGSWHLALLLAIFNLYCGFLFPAAFSLSPIFPHTYFLTLPLLRSSFSLDPNLSQSYTKPMLPHNLFLQMTVIRNS